MTAGSDRWARLRGWIQAIAALAAIIIAGLAIDIQITAVETQKTAIDIQNTLAEQEHKIQRRIAEQDRHRAAVARSVALYRDFIDSEGVKLLRRTAYEIEHALWQSGSPGLEKWGTREFTEGKEHTVAVFGHKGFQDKQKELRHGLSELLQSVNVIYRCGKFRLLYEKKQTKKNKGGNLTVEQEKEEVDDKDDAELCDRRTISVLLGGVLTEFFWNYRPVLYCDPFFKRYQMCGLVR